MKKRITKDNYKFKFTIIMSVYNVEEFIDEAIESILKQDIGFEENVQIVLVDDGSPDKCGEICDAYAKKHPRNIVVKHKKNGGVASAKNVGIRFAEGKYINYMDPDDKLSLDTLSKVWTFFEAHEKEIDVACIPLYFFDAYNGSHYLNNKFDKGTRVIDLTKESSAMLFSMASGFFHSRIKKALRCDERLRTTEDFKLIYYILIEKQKLGVISDCVYHYRRRLDGNSLIQSAQQNENWYFSVIENFYLPFLKYAQKRFGVVPDYIQYAIFADLKWKLNQPIEKNLLANDTDKLERYKKLLYECYNYATPNFISKFKLHHGYDKFFILNKIMNKKITKNICESADDEFYTCGKNKLFYISNMGLYFSFFDVSGNTVTITFALDFLEQMSEFDVKVKVNNKLYNAKKLNKIVKTDKLNDNYTNKIYFSFDFSLSCEPLYFSFYLVDKITKKHIVLLSRFYEKFFPLNNIKNSYFCFNNYVFKAIDKKTFVIKKCKNPFKKLYYELKYDKYLKKSNVLKANKIILMRWYYKIYKFFHKKPRWLITDRINKAGDNGEAFFRYLHSIKFNKAKYKYAISKCEDYYMLKKEFRNVFDLNTKKYYLEYLLADDIISAQMDAYVMYPLDQKQIYLRDITWFKNVVFLQHGVIMNDLSDWLNRFNKNITGFIVSAQLEKSFILEDAYSYNNKKVWLTGLARFDRLYHDEKKLITITPTWRKYLVGTFDKLSGKWNLLPGFTESEYFKFFNSLINDKNLINFAKKYGYRLAFLPHPNIVPYIDLFDRNDDVEFLSIKTPYKEIFAQSNLIISDYSSVIYDFIYLRKPIIYTQFDKKLFFESHLCKEKLNFESDGFGEVCYDYETTVKTIKDYIKTDCALKDKYRKRIDNFYEYNDKNNSKRICDKIVELDEQRGRKYGKN